MTCRSRHWSGLILALAVFCVAPAQVFAEQTTSKILPRKTEITDADGNPRYVIPLRVFTDYGFGATKSDPGAANKVDMERHRITAGVDFMTSSLWFWGITLGYSHLEDNGSAPFVPSIDTRKDLPDVSAYVARQITGELLAGGSFYFGNADGRSVFNGADVINENSYYYSFGPFVKYSIALGKATKLVLGGRLTASFDEYIWDNNIPPTANTNRVLLNLPASLSHVITPNFTLTANVQLNQTLTVKTFANVPPPDRTTLTIGGRATFTLPNGAQVYVSTSHDAFDHSYDAYRVNVGLVYTLFNPLAEQ